MKALLLIDIQNDFVPGGSLAVQEGNAIVPIVNQLQAHYDFIVATQDWHPAQHGSFAANHPQHKIGEIIELNGLAQILWPVHCVQNTEGAEFVPELNTEKLRKIFFKGTDPSIDSYSGFFDNGHKKATGLGDYLKENEITEVYIVGLATDYCVKYTALDALELGFITYVVADACRGVNLQPQDVENALKEMEAKGVRLINSRNMF